MLTKVSPANELRSSESGTTFYKFQKVTIRLINFVSRDKASRFLWIIILATF